MKQNSVPESGSDIDEYSALLETVTIRDLSIFELRINDERENTDIRSSRSSNNESRVSYYRFPNNL